MSKVWLVSSLAVVFLAGCSPTVRAPGQVGMTAGDRFEPRTITVKAGATVTWINESSSLHTVTAYQDELPADAAYFASGGADDEQQARSETVEGLIEADDEFSVTFEEPGTYEYFCIPHESTGMKGTVIVQ